MGPRDTGDVAHVTPAERLEVDDGHPHDVADPDHADDLGDVYGDPGEVVEEPLS